MATLGAYSGAWRRGAQRRNYGYYRCTGTHSYRFDGQPICDNPATRADRLDAAVWGEVRTLLEEPERLLAEYQRRLQDPEQEAR
jgi:site-specific DNA recombinase